MLQLQLQLQYTVHVQEWVVDDAASFSFSLPGAWRDNWDYHSVKAVNHTAIHDTVDLVNSQTTFFISRM